jgi:hypothetical protein
VFLNLEIEEAVGETNPNPILIISKTVYCNST